MRLLIAKKNPPKAQLQNSPPCAIPSIRPSQEATYMRSFAAMATVLFCLTFYGPSRQNTTWSGRIIWLSICVHVGHSMFPASSHRNSDSSLDPMMLAIPHPLSNSQIWLDQFAGKLRMAAYNSIIHYVAIAFLNLNAAWCQRFLTDGFQYILDVSKRTWKTTINLKKPRASGVFFVV